MDIKLRDYQSESIETIKQCEKGKRKLIVLPTGCHQKGQKVIMYDGTFRNVEDIKIGDQLMGIDSSPRTVLKLHRGSEEMYRISPIKGKPFVVNKGHILSLKSTRQRSGGNRKCHDSEQEGKITNVSVGEYLQKSNHFKHINKLYRTSVEFKEKELSIDPYLLGLLLGDGDITNGRVCIITPDEEIVKEIYNFADKYNSRIRVYDKPNNKSNAYFFNIGNNSKVNNIKKELINLKLYNKCSGDKFIPQIYKTSSREQRLQLLAGLVDTDGHYNKGFEYVTKSKQLCEDVLYLSRSLGFSAYESIKYVKGEPYYRISISGELSEIPTKVKRKQSPPRKQKKSVLVTGFNVEYVGIDDYYGFTLNGDHLYLLDDFTVTHNSGKGIIIASLSYQINGRVLIVVPSKELREQNEEKIRLFDKDIDVGSVQGNLDEVNSKIVIASRQSLTHKKSNRMKRMLEHGDFEYVIIDEVHQAVDQVKKIVNKVNDDAKIIGLTATPYNKEMKKVFGQIDYRKTILDMIDDEYLCEPKAISIESKTDLRHVKMVAGEFNQKELETAVDNIERNQLVVKSYLEYAADRKSTLVFATGINHSKSLVEEFKLNGIDARSIDSKTDKVEREQIIKDFKNFKFPVLVNVAVLTTGFDHQPTDCVMIARPTRSKILYEQVIGRGLRLSPETNKKDCLIIDISDVVKSHDLMSLSTVFDMKINSGETTKQARVRNQREKEEEEQRLIDEEQKRLEEEKLRQQEIELKAKQIKLFNKNMKEQFTNAKYDWFKVDICTYALAYKLNTYVVIEEDDSNFKCYAMKLDTDDKRIKHLHTLSSIKEMVDYVENDLVKTENSFVMKDSSWKNAKPTANQLKYVAWARTKFDVTKYFDGNKIKGMLKKYHKYGEV